MCALGKHRPNKANQKYVSYNLRPAGYRLGLSIFFVKSLSLASIFALRNTTDEEKRVSFCIGMLNQTASRTNSVVAAVAVAAAAAAFLIISVHYRSH